MTDFFEREPMIEAFVFETGQLIQQLEQILIDCEENKTIESGVKEIFRIMHTIKGSAAMIPFDSISGVAHCIEDVFHYLREEDTRNVDYSSVTDAVFKGMDFIKTEIEKIERGKEPDGDASILMENIKSLLSDLKSIPNKKKYYKAVVFFENDCGMENVRAYNIIHKLKDMACNIIHNPSDIIENGEGATDIIRKDGFRIEFDSDEEFEKIKDFLENTAFLKDFELDINGKSDRKSSEEKDNAKSGGHRKPDEKPNAKSGEYPKPDEKPNAKSGKHLKTSGDKKADTGTGFMKNEIIFRRFNLMNNIIPFKKKFHAIFCRNVMIYFEEKTKTEAKEKIIELKPDVMTLDIEMPKMNGIDFLKEFMPKRPIPTVVVNSVSERVFDALNAGAVDFITKPDFKSRKEIESLMKELIIKIKAASKAHIRHLTTDKKQKKKEIFGPGNMQNCIIAIGASTGGTEAISNILNSFPKATPAVLIVQHMPPVFTRMFAERLDRMCRMDVKEAKSGDRIIPGKALIAPGGYQMEMKRKGRLYTVECFKGKKVSGHRPSIDVLFHSVAEFAGKRAVGVILTGMGHDGAKGLLTMRRKGVDTIGQDEASCSVYGMPRVAYNIGAVKKQVSLSSIPDTIFSLLNTRQ